MMENVRQFSDRSSIDKEAREWLIRLDSDEPLGADVDRALREWIARSPAHRQELQRICRFWNRANILTELAIPLRELTRGQKSGWFNSTWMAFLRMHSAGAALALVLLGVPVVLTSWLMPEADTRTNGVYETAVGQRQTVVLADGSTMQMNTDSEVRVSYDGDTRRVRLLRGEALFDVKADAGRPFEVHAGKGVVRAVGTAFSVYLKNGDINVTVAEGQVDLASIETRQTTGSAHTSMPEMVAEKLASVRSGQAAVFQEVRKEVRISQLASQELQRRWSWRDGYLVFAGEPLSEVIAEVNRYTALTVDIDDPQLKSLPIGGRFMVGDLEAIFDVLETSFGIQITRISDEHVRMQLPLE